MLIGVDARYLGAANSGLARYSENLLEALARQDTHNQYIVFVNTGLKRRLKLGPNFRLLPVRGRPNSLRSQIRFARIVRHESLDLLHAHYPLAPPLVNCPVIITVHDLMPYIMEDNVFRLRLGLSRWLWAYMLYPMSLRRAKWVICVSRATRDGLCQLFPQIFHNTVIVHSGANEAFRLPVAPTTVDLVRSRLNLPEDYILYSGSVRSGKNIDGMLQAFATLRQRNPGLEHLHFVLEVSGETFALPELHRMIQQFGLQDRVRVTRNAGEEERRVIFEQAKLLFLLSRHEGFGFPILEAQLCNLPVLAADAGSLAEIAGDQGAVFVDPDNQDEVVAMMERILSSADLRAYLIENGRRNAGRFDWNRTAERIIQMYDYLFYPRELVTMPPKQPLGNFL